MRNDLPTMVNHLRKCPLQPSDVTDWACGQHINKYDRSSGSGPRSVSSTPAIAPQPMFLHPSSSHQPLQNIPGPSFQQFSTNPFISQPSLSPQLSPLLINNPSPTTIINAPIPLPHPPNANALGFLMHGSPNISSGPPSRPSSGPLSHLQGPSISRPQSQFSHGFDQQSFNIHIGRITVAAGLSISWTDNPEVRSVFRMFFPWVQLPSRKTLSRSVLPALQSSLRAQAQKETRGTNCTLQCDGWTGVNSHHLIAFMITVWPKVCIYVYSDIFFCYISSPGQIYSIRVHDAHGQEKNAENLLQLLLSVIEDVKNGWRSNVVAVCSDASGESRKARRLLREMYPHLVTLDCYAHQVCRDFCLYIYICLQFIDKPHCWRFLQMQLKCFGICGPR